MGGKVLKSIGRTDGRQAPETGWREIQNFKAGMQ